MEQLIMSQVTFNITSFCNLNCKLCAAYIPYRHHEHTCIDTLKRSITQYFHITNHTKKFVLSGGEPLLYPDLSAIIQHTHQYRSQIDTFQIITNGTLDITPQLKKVLPLIRDYGHFLVDDYGPDLSKNIPALTHSLDEISFPYVVRQNNAHICHCGGWVDLGDLTTKQFTERADQMRNLSACSFYSKLHFCFNTLNGIMYPCTSVKRTIDLGTLPPDDRYFINLLDDTLTVAQQREKLYNLMHTDYLPACAYCNGMHDDSPRFTPAQQLTKEELECVRRGARSYYEVCRMLGKPFPHKEEIL